MIYRSRVTLKINFKSETTPQLQTTIVPILCKCVLRHNDSIDGLFCQYFHCLRFPSNTFRFLALTTDLSSLSLLKRAPGAF